jgi:hypothetical protein
LLLLSQMPTGLADGFGLKELPYLPGEGEYTPDYLGPPFPHPAGFGSAIRLLVGICILAGNQSRRLSTTIACPRPAVK